MSEPTPVQRPPVDEAGAGANWIVLQFLLHAAAGVVSGRVVLLTVAGLAVAEGLAWACLGFEAQSGEPLLLSPSLGDARHVDAWSLTEQGWRSQSRYWSSFVTPFATPPTSQGAGVLQGLSGIARIVVWSLFGVAIARVAAMHLTHNDRPSVRRALVQAKDGWFGQAMGPLSLLAAIGAIAGLVWLLGAVSQVRVMMLFATPVALLLSLGGALLAIVLSVGAPFIWAASAVEREDPFDAVSRAVGYVYQRPLRLIAYTLQALAIGAVGGAVVLLVARVSVFFMLAWANGYGEPTGEGEAQAVGAAARLMASVIGWLPMVFHAAYFWFASVAVYLLLRRDIDEKQCDEVCLEEPPAVAVQSAPASPDA